MVQFVAVPVSGGINFSFMKAAADSKPAPKSESRKQRLERIRLAVTAGTYTVDELAISRAIVRKSISPKQADR